MKNIQKKFIIALVLILNSYIIQSSSFEMLDSSYSNKSNLAKKNSKPNQIEFKGVTFVGDKYCPEVSYESELAKQSMTNLNKTGANWVAIVVTEYQDSYNSTQIYPLYGEDAIKNDYYTYKTETIQGLTSIITHARSIGLKVMLKPHIDIAKEKDYRVHWRGDIGKGFSERDWELWFESYNSFLFKYAKLANDLNVEMFSISCELIATNSQEAHWRKLIKEVRSNYSGLLVDSANHDGEEYNKPWWDAVDYIGVDAYYLPIQSTDLLSDIKSQETKLKDSLKSLKGLSKKLGKDVIITEIGFCSGDCRIGDRKKISTIKDQYIQAYFYESFINIFGKKRFIKGYFWWAWNSDPNYGGMEDHCISPQNKFAEFVLTKYYGGNYTGTLTRLGNKQEPKCLCTI